MFQIPSIHHTFKKLSYIVTKFPKFPLFKLEDSSYRQRVGWIISQDIFCVRFLIFFHKIMTMVLARLATAESIHGLSIFYVMESELLFLIVLYNISSAQTTQQLAFQQPYFLIVKITIHVLSDLLFVCPFSSWSCSETVKNRLLHLWHLWFI